MKKKTLYFPLFMLCIAILMFGVYALKYATLNANASVGFIAHDCELSFYGTINGAVSNPDNMDRELTETFYFGDVDNQLEIKEDVVYEFKDVLSNIDRTTYYDKIYFNDAGEEIPTIVVALYITNLSAYSVTAELENLSSETAIEMSDQTRLNCVVNDWTGLVLLEYELKEDVTEVNTDNNFSIKISFKKRIETQNLEYTPIYAVSQTSAVNGKKASFVEDSSDIIGYSVSGMGECTDTDLVIPGRYNGKLVTEIGDNAFSGKTITSLDLPPTITRIGKSAFKGVGGLKKLVVPASVNQIDNSAFENCVDLEEVVIADNTSDGKNYEPVNPEVPSQPGEPSSPNAPKIKPLGILDSVFKGCQNLSNVELPTFVWKIGDYAFENCTSIPEIKLPESLLALGSNPFKDCNLPKIEIPQSVTKIGDVILDGTVTIRNVIVDGVEYVVDDTLSDIAEEVNKDIELPEEAEEELKGTNYYDENLNNNPDGEPTTPSVDKTTIPSENGYSSLQIKTLQIPYGVTRIEEYAFFGCAMLEEVFIPSTVTYIGAYAFGNCIALTTIEIPRSVSYMGENVFNRCNSLESIYIKLKSKPDTWVENWRGRNNSKVYWNGVLDTKTEYDTSVLKLEDGTINVSGIEYQYINYGVESDGVTPIRWILIKQVEDVDKNTYFFMSEYAISASRYYNNNYSGNAYGPSVIRSHVLSYMSNIAQSSNPSDTFENTDELVTPYYMPDVGCTDKYWIPSLYEYYGATNYGAHTQVLFANENIVAANYEVYTMINATYGYSGNYYNVAAKVSNVALWLRTPTLSNRAVTSHGSSWWDGNGCDCIYGVRPAFQIVL